MKRYAILSSDALKILAMAFMLIDHLWATVIPGNQWMNVVGRLAFPIFAFMISEGFLHTSNFKRYAKRLFFFGLISEIPFNLMSAGSVIFPFHQNVMFTLLLGLLCINELHKFKCCPSIKNGIWCVLKSCLLLLLGTVCFVDYSAMGILTVVVFYVFRDFKLSSLCRFFALVLLFIVFFKGQSFVFTLAGREIFFPLQGFGVLSLVPISLYNGKRICTSKAVKYAFYVFYPAHMALIYLVYRLAF